MGRVENIVGKGENAGYLLFFLFPQYFQKATFAGSLKVGVVWCTVKFSRLRVNSFPNKQTLDSSKLKEFANDNFKFDEMAKVSQKGAMHRGKRRNCSLRVIFLQFLHKDLYRGHVKTRACLGKGWLFTKRQMFETDQIQKICRQHINV